MLGFALRGFPVADDGSQPSTPDGEQRANAPLVPTSQPAGTEEALPVGASPTGAAAAIADGSSHAHAGSLVGLSIGAIGVVFGDIGTSPLYAIQEMVIKHGSADRAFVLGILRVVFWALFLIVVLKYQLLIMRATNRGEGGLFALLSLLPRGLQRRADYRLAFFGAIAIIGSALLFGDGATWSRTVQCEAWHGRVRSARPRRPFKSYPTAASCAAQWRHHARRAVPSGHGAC